MEITTPAAWEAAQETFDWFHDSVTRSLVFVSDQRVLPDGSMEMGRGEAVLRVIVQTQSPEHPGGEIIFRGVHNVEYDSQRDFQPGELTTVSVREGEFFCFRFGECLVLARSATVTPMDWQQSDAAIPR